MVAVPKLKHNTIRSGAGSIPVRRDPALFQRLPILDGHTRAFIENDKIAQPRWLH